MSTLKRRSSVGPTIRVDEKPGRGGGRTARGRAPSGRGGGGRIGKPQGPRATSPRVRRGSSTSDIVSANELKQRNFFADDGDAHIADGCNTADDSDAPPPPPPTGMKIVTPPSDISDDNNDDNTRDDNESQSSTLDGSMNDPDDELMRDLLNARSDDEKNSDRGLDNYFDEDEDEDEDDDEYLVAQLDNFDNFDEEDEEEVVVNAYDNFDEQEEHKKLLDALADAIGESDEELDEEDDDDDDEEDDIIDIGRDSVDGQELQAEHDAMADPVLLSDGIRSPRANIASPRQSPRGARVKSPEGATSPAVKRRDKVKSRVMDEILATEKTYFSRLCLLVDSFLDPLVRYIDQTQTGHSGNVPMRTTSSRSEAEGVRSVPTRTTSSNKGAVPPRTTSNRSDTEREKPDVSANMFAPPDANDAATVEDLFGNVREIRDFTKQLLLELEEQRSSEQNIGLPFINHCDSDFLDMYHSYMRTYKEGRARLDRLQGRYWFSVFVSAIELQPQAQNLLLRDFLIEPVQRVPRYKLLLGELVKHTEDGEKLESLQRALNQVAQVASDMNSRMNEYEQVNKIQLLSQCWSFDLRKEGRVFLKEGILTKSDRRGRPSPYHFLLFNDLLLFGNATGRRGSFKANTSNGTNQKFKLKFRVPMSDCMLIDGKMAINSRQTRLLSDLPSLSSLAERVEQRRRSSTGLAMLDLSSLTKSEPVGLDDVVGLDNEDLEVAAARAAASMVSSVAKMEDEDRRLDLEARTWKAVLDSGMTMEKLLGLVDTGIVIATPIKALVLKASNSHHHAAWTEALGNALLKLQKPLGISAPTAVRPPSPASPGSLALPIRGGVVIKRGNGSPRAGRSMNTPAALFIAKHKDMLGDPAVLMPPPSPRVRRRSIGGFFGGGDEAEPSSPRPMGRRRSFFGGKLPAAVSVSSNSSSREVSKERNGSANREVSNERANRETPHKDLEL